MKKQGAVCVGLMDRASRLARGKEMVVFLHVVPVNGFNKNSRHPQIKKVLTQGAVMACDVF